MLMLTIPVDESSKPRTVSLDSSSAESNTDNPSSVPVNA